MTAGTAPSPKTSTFGRRFQETLSAYPGAAEIGAYALTAMVMLAVAYLTIFTIFQPYDDEGTVLAPLQAFTNGAALYSDITTPYGPFFYELFGGFFALTGSAVTTDASRTIVIVVWVLTSLLLGLGAQRLSGRLSIGLAAMIAAFGALGVLVNEPMHPQGLCVLLIAALVLLVVAGPARGTWNGAACGALIAALTLTKINLGGFAIAAVAIAAVWTVAGFATRRWLLALVAAAFFAVPIFVLSRDLGLAWVRELLILELLAMVALLTAAWPLRARAGEGDAALTRWLAAGAAGFLAAFVVILAIVFATGSSSSDVYDGVITDALKIRDVLFIPFAFPASALDWGVIAVAAAALTVRLRGAGSRATLWFGLARAAAGVAILLAITRITVIGFNPSSQNPEVIPLVLAWLAAVPPPGPRESARKRFLRVFLPALAIAETLLVYPVAGSQTGIAAVAFVPVAALCLADGLAELRAWAAAGAGALSARVAAIATAGCLALTAILALNVVILPGATRLSTYRDGVSPNLPGASLLRLPPPQAELYEGLVELLRRHRCTALIGYPSLNSLYLWSGLEAPAPQVPNAWMELLDSAQQQRVVDQLEASARPCAIRDEKFAEMYLGAAPPPDRPLVGYVMSRFEPVDEIGEWQFLLPKGGSGS